MFCKQSHDKSAAQIDAATSSTTEADPQGVAPGSTDPPFSVVIDLKPSSPTPLVHVFADVIFPSSSTDGARGDGVVNKHAIASMLLFAQSSNVDMDLMSVQLVRSYSSARMEYTFKGTSPLIARILLESEIVDLQLPSESRDSTSFIIRASKSRSSSHTSSSRSRTERASPAPSPHFIRLRHLSPEMSVFAVKQALIEAGFECRYLHLNSFTVAVGKDTDVCRTAQRFGLFEKFRLVKCRFLQNELKYLGVRLTAACRCCVAHSIGPVASIAASTRDKITKI